MQVCHIGQPLGDQFVIDSQDLQGAFGVVAMRRADTVKHLAVRTGIGTEEWIEIFLQLIISQIHWHIVEFSGRDLILPHGLIPLRQSLDYVGVVRQPFHQGRGDRYFNVVAPAGFLPFQQRENHGACSQRHGVGGA